MAYATPSSGGTPRNAPTAKKTGNASQKNGICLKNLGIGGQNLSIGEKTLGLVEFLRAELTYISKYDARSEGTRRNRQETSPVGLGYSRCQGG